jgi:uncharacterized glyoxalase superfamily protein PhnB
MTDQQHHPTAAVWPALRYDDAMAGLTFLVKAFGFHETLVVPGDDERIEHAELRWPRGGGVMLGSTRDDGRVAAGQRVIGWTYLVTDEPDALFERATGAGAEVVDGLKDEDYGSRGFTVRDPEGNLWTFGTYEGA